MPVPIRSFFSKKLQQPEPLPISKDDTPLATADPVRAKARDAKLAARGIQMHPLPHGDMAQVFMRGGQTLAAPKPGDDVELYAQGDKADEGVWVRGFVALSGIRTGTMGGPYDNQSVVLVCRESEVQTDLSKKQPASEWPASLLRLAKGSKTPFAENGAQNSYQGRTGAATGQQQDQSAKFTSDALFFRPDQTRGYHGKWIDEGRQAYRQWVASGGASRPEIKKPVPTGKDKAILLDREALAEMTITKESIANRLVLIVNSATDAEKKLWGDWYIKRNAEEQLIADKWGVPLYVVAGAIAATSPQTRWRNDNEKDFVTSNQNVADRALHIALDPAFTEKQVTITQKMADEYERAQIQRRDEANVKKIAEGKKPTNTKILSWQSYNGSDFYYPQGISLVGTHALGDLPADVAVDLEGEYIAAMHENATKAVMIGRGADPALVLGGGGKTRSFYNDIIAPTTSTSVTVDVHMVRGLLDRLDLSDDDLGALVGNDAEKYMVFVEGVQMGAAKLSMLPSRAQAIFWEKWRNMHDAAERNRLTRSGQTGIEKYVKN